jgi:hypothetical protein
MKVTHEQPEPWVKSYCGGKPNYTTPAEQKPVAWMLPRTDSIITAATKVYRGVLAEDYTQPLYANPPSREWRGLTDTERAAVQYESFKRGLTPLEFMELHEAALRSQNHD